MPDTLRKHALNPLPPHRSRPPILRIILPRLRRPIIVIPKHTRPLLHCLVVVLRPQRAVIRAVVDLHPWPRAVVAGVHVEDDLGPFLRCGDGLPVCAGGVPSGDAVGGGLEAAGGDAGVGDARGEEVRVGGCHDVLGGVRDCG